MAEVQYGGQAVIEGVMMRGPKRLALAVRKPTGDILVEARDFVPWAYRIRWLRFPFLRGVVALLESVVLGIQYLSLSAGLALEEEGEELKTKDLVVTVVLALALAVGVFVLFPAAVAVWVRPWFSTFGQNLLEGAVRLILFLAYIVAIGQVGDIQRVFRYHGAEHKVINALEAGEELTLERVRIYSTVHPRCGTSFLLLVLLLSVFFFSILGKGGLWWRLTSRILLMPLVAGTAYELIKWAGRYPRSVWVRLLMAPGLWLQRLTTREPDEEMLEVAIQALLAAKGEVGAREVV